MPDFGQLNLRTKLLTARTFLTAKLIGQRARSLDDFQPLICLVLGSGQGEAAEIIMPEAKKIPFADIPFFPVPSVQGHSGVLHYGHFGNSNQLMVILQGRCHTYEGYTAQEVAFPVMAIGAKVAILTNAAGIINTAYQVGDLVVITDHSSLRLNDDPLKGDVDLGLGKEFYPTNNLYDPRLRQIALNCLEELGRPAHSGSYAFLPFRRRYETPREIAELSQLGHDLVGMSTVPEALGAHYFGQKVLAISLGTNYAAGIKGSVPDNDEVKEVGEANVQFQAEFLKQLIAAIITG